jgi:hypothetical protein
MALGPMSSEYRVAGARCTFVERGAAAHGQIVPKKFVSLKIAAIQRVMSRSCSTFSSLGHGAFACQAMISRCDIKP